MPMKLTAGRSIINRLLQTLNANRAVRDNGQSTGDHALAGSMDFGALGSA